MQDQLTDHLDQQLKSTSLENFSDYLLALCLGAHMDLKTTQHALRIAAYQ